MRLIPVGFSRETISQHPGLLVHLNRRGKYSKRTSHINTKIGEFCSDILWVILTDFLPTFRPGFDFKRRARPYNNRQRDILTERRGKIPHWASNMGTAQVYNNEKMCTAWLKTRYLYWRKTGVNCEGFSVREVGRCNERSNFDPWAPGPRNREMNDSAAEICKVFS